MTCLKCDNHFVKIHGTFSGTQSIEFHPDGELEVIDSDPGDFEWELDTTVECLDCNHTATVREFQEGE